MTSRKSLQDIFHFEAEGTLPLPGPFGRMVRLVLGLLIAKLVVEWLAWMGSSSAGITSLLVWVAFSVLLVPYVINIGFGINTGSKPRYILVAWWVLAAITGFMVEGSWLSEALWSAIALSQLYIYGHLGLSFLLSAILRTPGCEMRAIPHLLGKVSGRGSREHYCPRFIDGIDRWERNRNQGETPGLKNKVHFLWFDGCPLAPAARIALNEALEQIKGRGTYELREVDLMAVNTAPEMKAWGSPTILLNGLDITGAEPGAATNCRIYPGPGGVPSVQDIVAALTRKNSACGEESNEMEIAH